MNEKLLWFVLGIASLLFVKYIVIGTKKWNEIFHPLRVDAETQFSRGLLFQ